MQAKPIIYNDIHFRSRIEVRWSIVFSTLQAEWKYEIQHYDFGRKRPWLEDEYEFREHVQESRYETDYETESDFYAQMYKERYEHDMYLPDFFLPEFQHWVEIKGKSPTYSEISKAKDLSRKTNQPVSILWGYIPDPEAKLWGECSDVYGSKDNISILGILTMAYGVSAMQAALRAGRRIHF